MKSVTKILLSVAALLCAAAMLFALSSCSGGKTKAPDDPSPVTQSGGEQKTKFTVTFDTKGGSAVASQSVEEGAYATQPADPTKDGFLFGGWTKDEAGNEPYEFESTAVTADVTIYAVWNDASDSSTAKFMLNYEGAGEHTSKVFANDSRISKPENPVREGYAFAGWFADTEFTEAFSDMKKYTGDQTFYAKWLTIYTLEAENTQLSGLDPATDTTATSSGNKIGYGRSGEASGTSMISKRNDASGGYYVHGLYYTDAYLAFEITSDKAVSDAQIVVRLAAEFKDYSLTKDDFAVEVNGKELKYKSTIGLTQDAPFADFVISTEVSLKEGDNLIRLVVLNEEKQFGDGTVNAAAPMVDCIYIYSQSVITMNLYNTDITNK